MVTQTPATPDLSTQLVQHAAAHPPVTQVLTHFNPLFHLLERAFPDSPAVAQIVNEARTQSPKGIIVFGYDDNTSMKPITDILDKIPQVKYHSIELEDGRTLSFMSHAAARAHLPQPGNIQYSVNAGHFNEVLIPVLEAKINKLAGYSQPRSTETSFWHR
jgi:hypothetical protein